MGVSVEENLIRDKRLDQVHRGKISALLAVIGLIHDLGNPPYGHYGEVAIQIFFEDWFKNNHKGIEIAKSLGEEKLADFVNFEGNAQTFRLLTKLHNLKDEFGYNLSVASLAGIMKYPRSSTEGNKSNEYCRDNNLGVSYEKFGYLQSEERRFKLVQEYTKIDEYRHPVTFLLEAADDIAYLAADLEDGCKKKILDYRIIKEVLEDNLNHGNEDEKRLLKSFTDTYNGNKQDKNISNPLDNAMQKLRIEAQGYMIRSVVKEFLHREEDILHGNYDLEILKTSDGKNIRKAFRKLAGIVFANKEIITVELSGGRVIKGLLEMFTNAVLSDGRDKKGTEENKLYSLISDSYKDIMNNSPSERDGNGNPSVYDRLLLVTDFVCGMTDSYALDLYRRLNGIKL
jgi:dGTPase